MSDQNAEASSDEVATASDATFNDQDWFLEQLVRWADGGFEQSLILNVGGALISGRLIGGRAYFQKLANAMRALAPDANPESIAATVTTIYEEHRDIYPDPEADDDNHEQGPPKYIHLAEAKWFSTNGHSLPGNGTLWRGKISAVDGLSFGELRPVED